mgnify:CR=1 FL=1
MKNLSITVGIPTCYGGVSLIATVKSIRASTVPIDHIIIMSDRTPITPSIRQELEHMGAQIYWNEVEGSQPKKLKQILDDLNCSTVVIIGLTTDHCISTTTRVAGNYGYNTYLVSDATATFNKVRQNGEIFNSELMHNTSLASLKDEFATILSSIELFEMLKL